MNIGVAIFHPDRLDVRFSELQKLRAITGRDWDDYVQSFAEQINLLSQHSESDEERLANIAAFERVIIPSDFGWLSVSDGEEYELRVREVLRSFVMKAGPDRKPREPRINTEIAQEFRRKKALAKKTEGLFSHKVVRNVEFEKHKGLKADFVLKNGVYHVTATLDLRKTNVKLDEACLKAVVLDKADDEFKGETRRFGVYATEDASSFREHIELLSDYADEVYNWLDPNEREVYQRKMFDALHSSSTIYRPIF